MTKVKQKWNFDKLQAILRKLALFSFYLIFVYWSSQAVFKYLSEPTNTSIEYTLGDNGKGTIKFPLVTFCNHDQAEQQLIFQNQCGFDNGHQGKE